MLVVVVLVGLVVVAVELDEDEEVLAASTGTAVEPQRWANLALSFGPMRLGLGMVWP